MKRGTGADALEEQSTQDGRRPRWGHRLSALLVLLCTLGAASALQAHGISAADQEAMAEGKVLPAGKHTSQTNF